LLFFNTREAWDNAIYVNRHLPDLSISELILELKKSFNVDVRLDMVSKRMYLGLMEDSLYFLQTLKDWSGKVGKLSGYNKPLEKIVYSYELDGNDGLSKTVDFESFSSTQSAVNNVNTVASKVLEIKTRLSPVTYNYDDDFTSLMCDMVGVTEGQPDAKFGARLTCYYANGYGADNYWDNIMTNGSRYIFFWQATEDLLKDGYVVDANMALDANDVAWVSEIFRGIRLDEAPKVHVHGVNYLIEKVIVPADGGLSKVRLRRLV
jgi:hypothetical protein